MNEQDAEDLVQDTYLKAARAADTFRGNRSSRSWLFRIMTNTYIDRFRRERQTPTSVELDDSRVATDDPPENTGDPNIDFWDGERLEWFLSRSLTDEVKNEIDRLPTKFREVVVLRDVEGFAYQEVADFLSIPIGTVMSRLYRARRELKTQLCEYATRAGYIAAMPELCGC